MVVFSGGEPTIRRDIAELARFAHGCGLKTGVVTNGRRFVYPGFARELYARGLRFAYVSFHSPSRKTHEISTRTDTLHEVLGAVGNLVKAGVSVTVNTVVTNHNIGELALAVDHLSRLNPYKIKFSILEPKGAALDDAALAPSLKASAEAISSAIRYGRSKYPGARFGCEGLTPCLLEDFETLNDDLIANKFSFFQEAFEKVLAVPDYRNRLKSKACFDCAWFERCPGIFSGYWPMRPPPPIRPEIRSRANSFVFVKRAGSLPAPARHGACPCRASGVRTVFLAEKGRLRAYRTSTSDFSDEEIAETLALGQIYLPRGGRHRGLDYGRDLVKLRPSPLCSSCPAERGCSRVYETAPGDVFAPLEAAVERLVRRLRGDVLEVGCGGIRFRGIIESLARAGKLRYVGIDPEPFRVPPARGMTLRQEAIEDFKAPDASFDHVMILRSYNHIRRPSEAFPKIRRLLRPGGTLSVVDGVAFGLLLPGRPERAGSGEFQHFRNHASGQARRLLESFGFRAVGERPVRPAGCSEWLLTLKKR